MDPKHSHGPDRTDYSETPEDLTEVHASILRENPEPSASSTPIPLWLLSVCGVAVTCAGFYLGMFHGGFRGDVFNERQSSPDLLFPQASTGAGAGAAVVAEAPLAKQGEAIYQNCQACHQTTGLGLPAQFPPLAKSGYVIQGEKRLVAILLKGIQGPFQLDGKPYNGGQMPAWEGALTDKKIAAVASFVRSSFGNGASEITPAKVAAARKEFADRKTSWSQADLDQIPADATLPDAAAPAGAPPAPNAAPATGLPATGNGTPPTSGAPAPAPAAPAVASAAAATPEQIATGKAIYMQICFACHQPNGLGLPSVFPPLVKSEYVNGSAERFAAMILKGNNPPMTVNGVTYAAAVMPAQEAALPDEKIALVMTYVRASFGNNAPPVTPDVVAAARAKFAEKHTAWSEAELKAFDTTAPVAPGTPPEAPLKPVPASPAAPAPQSSGDAKPAEPSAPKPADPAPAQ